MSAFIAIRILFERNMYCISAPWVHCQKWQVKTIPLYLTLTSLLSHYVKKDVSENGNVHDVEFFLHQHGQFF